MLKKIKEYLYDSPMEYLKLLFGVVISCTAINLFIVPHSLYNGGVLGLSQLIRSLLNDYAHINSPFDYSGLIYYLLNIPIFIIGYKQISKKFVIRTILAVSLQTLFLSIIPTKLLLDDILASILVGGILGGIGTGFILSCGSSTGGTDIIGLVVAKKSNKLTVGKLGLIINVIIYTVAGILYGLPIMIYSLIFTVIFNLMVDRMHEQNICSTAFIFCKKNPKEINNYIKNELGRDFTYWDAKGGYDDSRTYIIYTALTKYELIKLERKLKYFDDHIFMIKSDGVGIKGEFDKKF